MDRDEAIRLLRDRTEAAIRFMPIYRHSEIPLAAGVTPISGLACATI